MNNKAAPGLDVISGRMKDKEGLTELVLVTPGREAQNCEDNALTKPVHFSSLELLTMNFE
jgi:hypothetical protein